MNNNQDQTNAHSMKSNPINKYFSGVKETSMFWCRSYSFIELANALRESDFSTKNEMERNRRKHTCGRSIQLKWFFKN